MSSYLLERPISSSSVSTTVSLESKGCRRRLGGSDAGVRAAQRAQFFKTRLCPHQSRGRCLKGDQCTYAHSDSELLPSVNLTKTKLCQSFMAGNCERPGAECPFAHGVEELRATRGFYKTQTCKFWLAGYCPAGDKCRHAHGEQPRVIDMLEIGRRSSALTARVSMLIRPDECTRRRSVACGLLAPAAESTNNNVYHQSLDETNSVSSSEECLRWWGSRARSVGDDDIEDVCFDSTTAYFTDEDEP